MKTELEEVISKLIAALQKRVAQSSIRKVAQHYGISPATVLRLNRGGVPDVATLRKMEAVIRGEK